MKNKEPRLVYIIFGVTYFIIGLILIISAAFVYIKKSETIKVRDYVKAYVYEIDSSKKDITILYEVNDNIYFKKLDYYSSLLGKGDELNIYINKNDPNDFVSDSKIPEIIFIILGSVFTAIGTIIIGIHFVKLNSRNNLIKNGECFCGVIISVKENKNVTINNKHPYIAECEIHSPLDGKCIKCKSDNTMCDLSGFVGSEVTVYADFNREKYYVDINELIEKYNADWS